MHGPRLLPITLRLNIVPRLDDDPIALLQVERADVVQELVGEEVGGAEPDVDFGAAAPFVFLEFEADEDVGVGEFVLEGFYYGGVGFGDLQDRDVDFAAMLLDLGVLAALDYGGVTAHRVDVAGFDGVCALALREQKEFVEEGLVSLGVVFYVGMWAWGELAATVVWVSEVEQAGYGAVSGRVAD